MARVIDFTAELRPLFEGASKRLGLHFPGAEQTRRELDSDHLSVFAIRSPQGQVATYPAVLCSAYRGRLSIKPFSDSPDNKREQLLTMIQNEVLVDMRSTDVSGTVAYRFSLSGMLLNRSGCIGPEALWSEEYAVVSVFENAIRANYDLPLGSTEMIRENWRVLQFVADSRLDMTQPLLHLFAHEPCYQIFKLTSHSGYVALSGVDDVDTKLEHAVDYLEGVVTE